MKPLNSFRPAVYDQSLKVHRIKKGLFLLKRAPNDLTLFILKQEKKNERENKMPTKYTFRKEISTLLLTGSVQLCPSYV